MHNRNRKKQSPADLLIIVGIALMLAPFLWSLKADDEQSRQVSVAENAEEREVANQASPVPSPKPLSRSTVTSPAAPQTMERWFIVIPRLNLEAAIVEETNESDLDRGPMHLRGTGWAGSGNCCIAAHKEKWFRGLRRMAIGDTVTLRARGKSYVYEVTGHVIVRADNVSVLKPTAKPIITLITCSGPAYFGRGNGRVIVTGELHKVE